MPAIAPTVVVEATLSPWLLGATGSSELGETTYPDGTLIDVTADVTNTAPIQVDYGIKGNGPLDRIASTGTMTFSLNNAANNSGGVVGYYSPGHANARTGWDIGLLVRLKLTYDGTTYYKFAGNLISVVPDAGSSGRRSVNCTAVDWMDEAARAKVRDVTVQIDKRADELIDSLVSNSVSKQPLATSYNTGQSTFEYAFDNLLDTQTSVLRALSDCVISELGYLYVKGDTTQGGTLKFEDRYARPKYGLADASFDNTMSGLEVDRGRQDVINRVYVVVHPRTADASDSVLYELTTTASVPSIPVDTTIELIAPFKESSIRGYRIAGSEVIAPSSGTDWIANTAADGSGTNITTSVDVTHSTTSANSVTFRIVNNSGVTAYITTLQVRGKALKDVTETVFSSTDAASQLEYGENDSRVSMKYESNTGAYASEVANWILNITKDARYVIKNFTLKSNSSTALMTQSLLREPGDKIAVAESVTGIAASGATGVQIGYFINGVSMTVNPGGIIDTSWVLAPANQQSAWVLGTAGASELGVTTNLAFAI
tara:strand:- start:32527 stop:34158 length:1632 start_codon:yes stop_codon:yes gene_type:complete